MVCRIARLWTRRSSVISVVHRIARLWTGWSQRGPRSGKGTWDHRAIVFTEVSAWVACSHVDRATWNWTTLGQGDVGQGDLELGRMGQGDVKQDDMELGSMGQGDVGHGDMKLGSMGDMGQDDMGLGNTGI